MPGIVKHISAYVIAWSVIAASAAPGSAQSLAVAQPGPSTAGASRTYTNGERRAPAGLIRFFCSKGAGCHCAESIFCQAVRNGERTRK